MLSLSIFANLGTIGANGDIAEYNGRSYSVVIAGWIACFALKAITERFTDNLQLADLAQVLDIQIDAAHGTLVHNNPMMCFDTALAWIRRNDSLIEYNLDRV